MAAPRIKILLETISRGVAPPRRPILRAEPKDVMCEGVNVCYLHDKSQINSDAPAEQQTQTGLN